MISGERRKSNRRSRSLLLAIFLMLALTSCSSEDNNVIVSRSTFDSTNHAVILAVRVLDPSTGSYALNIPESGFDINVGGEVIRPKLLKPTAAGATAEVNFIVTRRLSQVDWLRLKQAINQIDADELKHHVSVVPVPGVLPPTAEAELRNIGDISIVEADSAQTAEKLATQEFLGDHPILPIFLARSSEEARPLNPKLVCYRLDRSGFNGGFSTHQMLKTTIEANSHLYYLSFEDPSLDEVPELQVVARGQGGPWRGNYLPRLWRARAFHHFLIFLGFFLAIAVLMKYCWSIANALRMPFRGSLGAGRLEGSPNVGKVVTRHDKDSNFRLILTYLRGGSANSKIGHYTIENSVLVGGERGNSHEPQLIIPGAALLAGHVRFQFTSEGIFLMNLAGAGVRLDNNLVPPGKSVRIRNGCEVTLNLLTFGARVEVL